MQVPAVRKKNTETGVHQPAVTGVGATAKHDSCSTVWLLLPGAPTALGHTGACARNTCIQAGLRQTAVAVAVRAAAQHDS
jgi:hypothetical protein